MSKIPRFPNSSSLLNGCFNWMMNQTFTWKIGVSPNIPMVGGFNSTRLRNMIVKLERISPIFGVQMKNI